MVLLFLVTGLMFLVGLIALVGDWLTKRNRPLPPPDDPRLRNYLNERNWRAKRALLRRRWTA